ncbi:hypothetical protein TW95_gp1531 [Pandoravirus inopinatum]|uniref:Uncharacterized protein n=1 Tax=Pandoravirus inopinatum TaxID=1605721 RepID=A0A0B5J8L3_9VIRU|nr:hypothetical protein TW95_gp1531 [Pandoravirus inopinatum]AJF98265.1 hypothetical protein [Pandoravirus inopinatum]
MGQILQRGKVGVDLVKDLEHPINIAAAASLRGAPFLSRRQVVEAERGRHRRGRQKEKGLWAGNCEDPRQGSLTACKEGAVGAGNGADDKGILGGSGRRAKCAVGADSVWVGSLE